MHETFALFKREIYVLVELLAVMKCYPTVQKETAEAAHNDVFSQVTMEIEEENYSNQIERGYLKDLNTKLEGTNILRIYYYNTLHR